MERGRISRSVFFFAAFVLYMMWCFVVLGVDVVEMISLAWAVRALITRVARNRIDRFEVGAFGPLVPDQRVDMCSCSS